MLSAPRASTSSVWPLPSMPPSSSSGSGSVMIISTRAGASGMRTSNVRAIAAVCGPAATTTAGEMSSTATFARSRKRYRPGLLRRVLYFAVPAGFIAGAATFTGNAMARSNGVSLEESRTVAVIVLTILLLVLKLRSLEQGGPGFTRDRGPS